MTRQDDSGNEVDLPSSELPSVLPAGGSDVGIVTYYNKA